MGGICKIGRHFVAMRNFESKKGISIIKIIKMQKVLPIIRKYEIEPWRTTESRL